MAGKIGWELFRVEYKAALENGDDIGTAIADSYDKAVKTAVPPLGGTQKGQGSATVPGIIVKSPLKKVMAGMLNMFSCIRYGIKNILDRSRFK
jgi:hypothetical protein